MNKRLKHVITEWNPVPNPGEPFESRTIEVHREILEKFPPEEKYVWWGKIAKSGNLGMDPADIVLINKQIASGVEVHFYMYCPEKNSLHVGKLEEVSASDFRGDPHAPAYYSKFPKKYCIPFWFKLSDIRKLHLRRFRNAHILREVDKTFFDPVSTKKYYPRIVYEEPTQYFFNYSLTRQRRWYMQEGMGGIMPRCFKTGSMDCVCEEAQKPVSKKRIYIGMPFRPQYDNLYKHAIKPALKKLGLTSWKADEEPKNIDLMCNVCAGIQISGSAIVDISDWNANVLFELGLVYGLGKEAFIIKQKKAKVPVDLRGMLYIAYDNFDELQGTLSKRLKDYLKKDC